MDVIFSKNAEEELKTWLTSNKATAIKIYELIEDIKKNGYLSGIGKPEQLRYKDPPRYSRRITRGDRLVYRPYTEVDENDLFIVSCKGHYDDN